MGKIVATYKPGFVELRIPYDSFSTEEVEHRLEQILPILDTVFEADLIRDELTNELALKPNTSFLVQDMIYQYRLFEAYEAARLLVSVASGAESIANHGFPEFGSDENHDV